MQYLKKSFSVYMNFTEENQNRIFGKKNKGRKGVKICPKCGGSSISQTYVAYINVPNLNHAKCNNCGWVGFVKDLK